MKINKETVNIGYLLIEKYVEAPKGKIILLGTSKFSPYSIGKLLIGEDEGKFVLYPTHA